MFTQFQILLVVFGNAELLKKCIGICVYINMRSWSFATLRFYANWERTVVFAICVSISYKQ